MEAGAIQLVINTPLGGRSHYDEAAIRAMALRLQIRVPDDPLASAAAVEAIRARQEGRSAIASLQDHHRG